MEKPILHTGKALTRPQQKLIIGQGLKKTSDCCNSALSCCISNPNYNGNYCQILPGDPNVFPTSFCI
jgi:hypothetical protein